MFVYVMKEFLVNISMGWNLVYIFCEVLLFCFIYYNARVFVATFMWVKHVIISKYYSFRVHYLDNKVRELNREINYLYKKQRVLSKYNDRPLEYKVVCTQICALKMKRVKVINKMKTGRRVLETWY